MSGIYNLSDLQIRYQTDRTRILKFAKKFKVKVEGEILKLDSIEAQKFFKSLDLSLKANKLCKEANTLLGKKLYYYSLRKYKEAVNIVEDLGDLSARAVCHSNIGLILEILGDYSRALMNFKEALILTKESGDQLGTALQLENVGRNLQNEKKYSEVLKFFKQSFYILSQIDLERPLLYMKKKVESKIKEIEKISINK